MRSVEARPSNPCSEASKTAQFEPGLRLQNLPSIAVAISGARWDNGHVSGRVPKNGVLVCSNLARPIPANPIGKVTPMKLCPICATSYPDGHRTCPTHGAVLVDTPELPPGTMIRDCYRIERTLGKGGMGIVYLAEHTLMGEPRALKFLSGALASNPTFVQRFLQEARAANKLRHPNIAQTLELGQSEDGSFYISMEFVDGPSLRAILDQSPFGLPPDRAFNIVRGVAEALGAAHAKHMVHRDIKPENILLAWNAESETAKVVDFGIVAITDSVGRLTQTGKPLMTAQYAAPEQWRGSIAPSELDGRTDLYALGCMFFEMLTGQLAFQSDTYEGWFEQHVHGIPPRVSQIRPELAEYPGLDALVLQLMAKERDDRPANVRAFLAELDRVIAGQGTGIAEGANAGFGPSQRSRTAVDGPGQNSQPAMLSGLKPIPGYVPASQLAGAIEPPRLSKRARLIFRSFGAAVLLAVAGMIVALLLRQNDSSSHASTGSQIAIAPTAPSDSSGEASSGASSGSSGESPTPSTHSAKTRPSLPVPFQPSQPAANPVSPATDAASTGKAGRALYSQHKYSEAFPLLTSACDRSDAESCDFAGWMYEYHQGVQEDDARAVNLYDRGCTLGSMPACNNEGAMYEDHVGVAQSFPKAVELYNKSCEGNFAAGCDSLGYMYEAGHGVTQDYSRAVGLYRISCSGGYMHGCDSLGYMYQTGHGITQNYQEALTLYDKACTGNSMTGCKDLGWMYQHSLGVKQDYPKALDLYTKACDGDNPIACNSLGIMYEEHQGVTEDDPRAVTFYSKACDLDDGNGCSDLGNMYRFGKGTTKDPDKAKTLLTKGCNLGSKWGCDSLKEMQSGKS
jgi:TPR repeat protein